MSAAKLAIVCAVGCVLLAPAVERVRAQDDGGAEKAMEAYVRAQMAAARADCARKFAITRLPDNDIDGVAQYGAEKWFAFKDCLVDEVIVQHLPPRK